MSNGIASILLETPALALPTNMRGPINTLAAWSIRRELNKAGSWSLRFPLTEPLAAQVVTGWRCTLTQEGIIEDALLYRGKVLTHRYIIDASGQGLLELTGTDRLGVLGETVVHTGKTFTGKTLSEMIAGVTSASIPSPSAKDTATTADITFNDQTVLAVLVKLADLYRCNLREYWGPGIDAQMIDQDAMPNAEGGNVLLTNIGVSGPAVNDIFANSGIGIIAGAPTITYEGSSLINRITPIGTDFDGGPLTLQSFAAYDSLYTVVTGTNPDGTHYYYLEDTASQTKHGLIETEFVRSDAKNPSDSTSTKTAAQAVLHALASSELLRRRYEVVSVNVSVANGFDIYALPGDHVRVKYQGLARTIDGANTWLNLDTQMVIMGRTDSGTPSGVRSVSFDLAAPAVAYTIPNAPTAIAIPTPRKQDTHDKPKDPLPNDPKPDTSMDNPDGSGRGGGGSSQPGNPALTKALQDLTHGTGAYQACCPDQTSNLNQGGIIPKAGLGVPSGIIGAYHGGDVGTYIAGAASTTPPGASNAIRRIYIVEVWNSTGTPTSATGTWTSVFTSGSFSVWTYNAVAGGAGAPGAVSCPVSNAAPTGGAARSYRIDVDTSTAPITFQSSDQWTDYLSLSDENGIEQILTATGGAPLNHTPSNLVFTVVP